MCTNIAAGHVNLAVQWTLKMWIKRLGCFSTAFPKVPFCSHTACLRHTFCHFSRWYRHYLVPRIFPFIISHIWSYGEHMHYRGGGDKHPSNWGKKMFLCCRSYILWKVFFSILTHKLKLFADTNGDMHLLYSLGMFADRFHIEYTNDRLYYYIKILNKSNCFFNKCNVKFQLWLKCYKAAFVT